MNILLTSVGRRGYLVNYFKDALGSDGQVWGGDNCTYTAGFGYCDHRLTLPQVTEDHYPQRLVEICSDHKIDIVIPLIDPELEALAPYRQEFDKVGVMLLISPEKTIKMASDKYLTYQFAMDNGLGVPKTYIAIDEVMDRIASQALSWPVMVKPRKGSASLDIQICRDRLQLEAAFEVIPDPMVQELVSGTEYGYDLFGDQSCQPISIYCKRKISMRAGETDKAVSTNNPVLIEFGKKLLRKMQLFGPADVDVILTDEGPKLLEINPRFGGGYPCSHLSGADFCTKIIEMRKGQSLKPALDSCPDGICMLKQDEIIQPDWPLDI